MSGFTPASVPSFSVGAPEGQAISEAAQNAPKAVAQRDADTDVAKAQKAQADVQTQQAHTQLLQNLVAPAVSNPAVAENPQWQQMVGSKLKEAGLQLPFLPGAHGQTPGTPQKIDVQALQNMVSPVMKPNADPQAFAYLQNLPPGPAREAAASIFNPSSITPQVLQSPLVPDQKMKDQFSTEFDKMMLDAEQGKISPQGFLAWAKSRQSMLPYIGQTFEGINNNDLAVAGLGAATKATMQKLIDAGVMSRAKAALAMVDIDKVASIEQLNAARAKYLGQQGLVLNQREQIAYMNAQSNASKANTYAAEVGQKIANATNGSWADRQKLLQQDVHGVLDQKKTAEADMRALQLTMERARADGEDVTEKVNGQLSLLDALGEAQARVKAFDLTLSQIRDTSLTANAARGQLNAVGGPGTTNTPQNVKPPIDFASPAVKQSAKNPNVYWDTATNALWDKSANPPRYIGQMQ